MLVTPDASTQRTFYHVVGNTLFSTITTIIAWFAVTFWAYLQTESVLATSIMAVMFVVGNTVTGIIFGGLVDRYSKKRLMMLADALTAVLFAAALAIYLATPAEAFRRLDSAPLWAVIGLMFAGVLVPNIRVIIQATLVTAMIPEGERDKANGLTGIISGTSFTIGSIFSGLLLGTFGLGLILALPIVIRIITILHLRGLTIPELPRAAAETTHGPQPADGGFRETYRVVRVIPGLMAMIFFTCLNNFLGGAFFSLMDPYGLSLMSVEAWGIVSGVMGLGFLVGGIMIARFGLGKNPLRALFIANGIIWAGAAVFTLQPSIVLLIVGFLTFTSFSPFIEAAEHTIIQKLIPLERQGRVFGFAQSIESAASPVSTLLVGPLAQFVFIPFMTTGAGVALIGDWFGTGPARGLALVFTLAGVAGLVVTLMATRLPAYKRLAERYAQSTDAPPPSAPTLAPAAGD